MTTVARSTVIVVSYRPGRWLEPCLLSVVGRADQVVVVDNASEEAAASDIARRCGAPAVRSKRNLGFAGGVELGLAVADGDLIGVLNDDAVAGPNWLSAAEEVLRDPEVGACTPKVVLAGTWVEVVLPDEPWFAPGDARPLGRQIRSIRAAGEEVLERAIGDGLHPVEGPPGNRWRWTSGPRPFYVPAGEPSPGPSRSSDEGPSGAVPEVHIDGVPVAAGPSVRVLNHAGSFLRNHGIAGEYGLGAPDDGRFDTRREPFGFSGTAPVFRHETLRRLGGFATAFFAYNEDTDWCLRARLAGLRIVYDPAATVTHRLSATSGGTVATAVQQLSQRNALLCMVRNAPAGLARRHVAERLATRDPVARQVAARLPWAVASRVSLSRRWREDPCAIWGRWADRDTEWDASPVG